MASVSAAVLLFALSAVLLAQVAEAQVRRACKSDNDCVFVNAQARTVPLTLKCQGGKCTCERVPGNDDMEFSLTLEKGKCFAGDGGPCGKNNDIKVECEQGFKCLLKRCRNPTSGRAFKEPLNGPCNSDGECQQPLKCKAIDETRGSLCKPEHDEKW